MSYPLIICLLVIQFQDLHENYINHGQESSPGLGSGKAGNVFALKLVM